MRFARIAAILALTGWLIFVAIGVVNEGMPDGPGSLLAFLEIAVLPIIWLAMIFFPGRYRGDWLDVFIARRRLKKQRRTERLKSGSRGE